MVGGRGGVRRVQQDTIITWKKELQFQLQDKNKRLREIPNCTGTFAKKVYEVLPSMVSNLFCRSWHISMYLTWSLSLLEMPGCTRASIMAGKVWAELLKHIHLEK